MNEIQAFVKDFLAESYENLDQLDRDLVELEKNPTAAKQLASVFRTIHTLKGTAGFFGFSRLGALAHGGESLLSSLRNGTLHLDAPITSVLLAMLDAVRQMLSRIENTGQEGEEDYGVLIEKLTSFTQNIVHSGRGPDPGAISPDKTEAILPASAPCAARQASGTKVPLGELLIGEKLIGESEVAEALCEQLKGDPRPLGEILVAQGALNPGDVLRVLDTQTQSDLASPTSNVRVDVGQLDKLMNLVGELVLARNQILQFSVAQKDVGFLNATQRLNLITTELQEGVMKTRMQPIETVWSKFPRIVRDLAAHLHKRVQLEMVGSETELDRTLIEAVRDPLTHSVRNCVDHGIETPEKRISAGKPPEGRLVLRAFHEGGLVNIEISDDGAGIDLERVRSKAIELGLSTPEKARALDDRETMNLLFLPGFSTAEKVTDVSGRGVGMDVVKSNIEKIGGMVDLQSKLGQGTTIKIRIPLTLAIIPALMITSGGERYAIPQSSLLELVRLEGEKARRGIEMIHGSPVYRLRGNLLPLVYLNHELGAGPSISKSPPAKTGDGQITNIVVLHADNRQFGLVVDEVNDTGEIVVKPLGKQFKGISTFAGATIMGDGTVALILDVLGLAGRARVFSEGSNRKRPQKDSSSHQVAGDRQSMLLFTAAGDALMAIPLSAVTRLEEFPQSSVERTGRDEVVQYRGEILPLVDLCGLSMRNQSDDGRRGAGGIGREKIQVVVYSANGRRAGLKVERILDIVEDRITIQYPSNRKGSLGSAVIQGRVAEILDVEAIVLALGQGEILPRAAA